MTDTWAIAAVTQSFRKLLERMSADDSSFSPIEVSAKAPERILQDDSALAKRWLNVFLYRVARNPGLAGADLPIRNGEGELIGQPVLALDLYYLLTAYGLKHDEQDAQHVLAHAMSIAHDNGVLPRQQIAAAIAGTPMAASGLADQIERVTLSPVALGDEELFRMWTTFGSAYRISHGYMATAVLVERPKPTRSAPPVRSAGLTAATLRRPQIESIEPRLLTAGATIAIHGDNLRADEVTVRLATGDLSLTANQIVADTELQLTLPGGLRAGPNAVQVLHGVELANLPGETRPFAASEAFTFLLAPEIVTAAPITTQSLQGSTSANPKRELALDLKPPVARRQRVLALIGADAIERRPPADAAAEHSQASFAIPPGLAAGTYPLRIQVDGAESELLADNAGNYNQPKIKVKAT